MGGGFGRGTKTNIVLEIVNCCKAHIHTQNIVLFEFYFAYVHCIRTYLGYKIHVILCVCVVTLYPRAAEDAE